jgi:invasion protein IalB
MPNKMRAFHLAALAVAAALAVPPARAEGRKPARPGAPAAGSQTPASTLRTATKAIENWSVVCTYGKDDQKIGCAAVLRVIQRDSGKPGAVAMVWTIGKGADGKLVTSLETQTGLLVQPGVTLKLGDAASRTLPFALCTKAACVASAPMDETFEEQAIAAESVDATLQALDGKAYKYTFSPRGIEEAVEAVR